MPNRGTGSEGPTVIQELVETGTGSVPRETLGEIGTGSVEEIGTGSEVPVGAVPNTGTASVGHEFVEIGTGSMGHLIEDGVIFCGFERRFEVPQRGTAYQPGVQPRVWQTSDRRVLKERRITRHRPLAHS